MHPHIQSEFPAVSGSPLVGRRMAGKALSEWPFRKLFFRAAVGHVALVLLLFLWSAIFSFFHREPPEQIALITLQGSGSPDAPLRDPAPPPDPPQPPAPPQPTPPKTPDQKADIPDKALTPTNALATAKPAATNRPVIKVSTNVVAWKEPPKDTGNRSNPADLFKKDVQKGLATSGTSSPGPGYGRGSGGSGGMGGTGSGFLAMLDMYCRSAWEKNKPLESFEGKPAAEVWFLARRDGTVVSSGITRRSGYKAFDSAVERTLRDLVKLPALPPELYPSSPSKITVTFDFEALR